MLNHHLTEMSRIALDHGATIDKYVGDAIVIFFGDPETRGVREDALAWRSACASACWNWKRCGAPPVSPARCAGRMGIHTDYCTVGNNFGSEERLTYTIFGRGVNIASRLESLATPGEILVSYET